MFRRKCAEGAALAAAEHAEIFAPFGECTLSHFPYAYNPGVRHPPMNSPSPALARLVHEARTNGSRTVQTLALLVTIASVLMAASMRAAVSEKLVIELFMLLPMCGVLIYALDISQRLDMRLNVSLRALAETPAVRRTLQQADTRLQRIRRDARALFVYGCVLLDSFAWSRVAPLTPLSLRVEHLHELVGLVDLWWRNRRLGGDIDALAAQLLAGIDALWLRNLIDLLSAAVTPQRARATSGVLLALPTRPAPGCPAQAVTPALNRLC
jgi:hypothetical protein